VAGIDVWAIIVGQGDHVRCRAVVDAGAAVRNASDLRAGNT
jgi:hypothetical protein